MYLQVLYYLADHDSIHKVWEVHAGAYPGTSEIQNVVVACEW